MAVAVRAAAPEDLMDLMKDELAAETTAAGMRQVQEMVVVAMIYGKSLSVSYILVLSTFRCTLLMIS